MNSQWTFTTDRLPPQGRYVLVHLVNDNRRSETDPEGAYFDVAALEVGISSEVRQKMMLGEVPDLYDARFGRKRSSVIRVSDEHGNNLKPYAWRTFGPSTYFGQEIDRWMEIQRQ